MMSAVAAEVGNAKRQQFTDYYKTMVENTLVLQCSSMLYRKYQISKDLYLVSQGSVYIHLYGYGIVW